MNEEKRGYDLTLEILPSLITSSVEVGGSKSVSRSYIIYKLFIDNLLINLLT